MSSLFLSTLAMMGLTFMIGFFVAGVIKIIANWADFLNFYHSHRKDIHELRMARSTEVATLPEMIPVQERKTDHDKRRKLMQRISESLNNLTPRKRATA